jgi:hypothetical protein
MLSLAIVLLCVAVILVFAIYKISRENREATSTAYEPTNSVPQFGHSDESAHHDLINSLLQDDDLPSWNTNPKELFGDKMIPKSTIVAAVERFKSNYRGPNSHQVTAIVDEGLAELKSRFGDQISVHDLREFMKTQRQKLLSRMDQ